MTRLRTVVRLIVVLCLTGVAPLFGAETGPQQAKKGGERLQTPYLEFSYDTDWDWEQPPAP